MPKQYQEQIQKEHERRESLFERMCREERGRKLSRNDALFFGLSLLLAFYATKNVLTIQ